MNYNNTRPPPPPRTTHKTRTHDTGSIEWCIPLPCEPCSHEHESAGTMRCKCELGYGRSSVLSPSSIFSCGLTCACKAGGSCTVSRSAGILPGNDGTTKTEDGVVANHFFDG